MAERLPPAARRVVVVRAGVDDGIDFVVVRQVGVAGIAVEGELQDAHPRQTDRLPQGIHFRRDDPEVLGNDRQAPLAVAEFAAHGGEDRFAPSRSPLAVDCRLGSGGNLPERLEAAEVIDANDIAEAHRLAHPRDPPAMVKGARVSCRYVKP